jgi:anti-sigma factor RsiW
MGSNGINDEMILAYAAGELDADGAAAVERHLADHPDGLALVERYRAIRVLGRSDDSQAAPADLIQRARAIFDPTALPARVSWWETLERVVASLVFDSRTQPVAVRYAESSRQFQLAFEVGPVEVDLQLQRQAADPAGGGASSAWRLMGQLAAADETGEFRVAILDEHGRLHAETRADERGVFEATLEAGRYELIIDRSESTIALPSIELPVS